MVNPASDLELIAAVRQVLADGVPRDEEAIADALLDLGVVLDPADDPVDLVVEMMEWDIGPVVMVDHQRYVDLSGLLRGRTFTRRLSESEAAHDYLEIGADLDPPSYLRADDTHRHLVDGGEIVQVIPERDERQDELLVRRGLDPSELGDTVWLLPEGTLAAAGAAAGGLVGLTVRERGFALASVTEPAEAEVDAFAVRLAALVAADDHKREVCDLVWAACLDSTEAFAVPTLPLSELVDRAGLARRGPWVASAGFDFDRHHVDTRLDEVAEIYDLDDDDALAVVVLSHVFGQVAATFDQVLAAEQDDAGLDDVLDVIFEASPDDGAGPSEQTQLVRDMLVRLDHPPVAEALLAETIDAGRRDAAALGLFAETLEPQAPRPARASLRWLRGKALERLGNLAESEAAYDAAVTMDESCVLALYDLARIASDRGDAERGLSLLRRAGAPEDDDLVQLLQRFRAVERTDLGRNDPCWCGSGRKYKVCHRGRETPPLEDRAAWLYRKAGTYVADGPWRDDLIDLAMLRAEHQEDVRAAALRALDEGLVTDALMFEGGAFAAFVEERGELLPADELLLAQQWLLAERSVHEIEKVTPGQGFNARDLRTGERVDVRERTASRMLETGTLVCARLVPAGETVQCFGGLEPVTLHERDALLDLLDDEPHAPDVVAFLSRRFAPPTLANADGDPLVFCETTLTTSDRARLLAHLDATYERVDDEPRWLDGVSSGATTRVRTTFTLDGDELLVETNSERRMATAVADLTEAVPDLEVDRQVRRTVDELDADQGFVPADSPDLDELDPEVAEALRQVVQQHEEAWLDMEIPALAGVTPREAAADPTRRPDLVRLLDSLPPADGPGMMDPGRLRAALGL